MAVSLLHVFDIINCNYYRYFQILNIGTMPANYNSQTVGRHDSEVARISSSLPHRFSEVTYEKDLEFGSDVGSDGIER